MMKKHEKKFWNVARKSWITIKNHYHTDDMDKDGYCKCEGCQEQKAIEENCVPEELFEL